ncbi:MAG TPA: substrate-binding domain-containing protein [Bacteroidales bacterium]|nr:substrate-binding domain-containing protein [Bacteroidales bacterium]
MIQCRLVTFGVVAALLVASTGCNWFGSNRRESGQAEVALPENPNLILAAGTTTVDTGLMDTLVHLFESKTGYDVKLISMGSGAALAMAERGEVDVLLVHSPQQELLAVEKGFVEDRTFVMINDFVVVGPKPDPAQIKLLGSPAEAFMAIKRRGSPFVSRGDESGTHKLELQIWDEAGITPSGNWYAETGSGMGTTLNVASERQAYALTDRGTFVALSHNLDLAILLGDKPGMDNPYHILLTSMAASDKINREGAEAFRTFMLSEEAQKVIEIFGKAQFGQPLFFNAKSEIAASAGF